MVRVPRRFKKALVSWDGMSCVAVFNKYDEKGFRRVPCGWILNNRLLRIWLSHPCEESLFAFTDCAQIHFNKEIHQICSVTSEKFHSLGRKEIHQRTVWVWYDAFKTSCCIRWQCDTSGELHLISVTWGVKWSGPPLTGAVKGKQNKRHSLALSSALNDLLARTWCAAMA